MINCPRAVVLQDCRQSCLNLICFLASSEKEHIFSVIPFVKQKQLNVIKRFSLLIFLFNPTLAWKGLAGGGLVVRELPSTLTILDRIPLKSTFYCVHCIKTSKIKEKEDGSGHLKTLAQKSSKEHYRMVSPIQKQVLLTIPTHSSKKQPNLLLNGEVTLQAYVVFLIHSTSTY